MSYKKATEILPEQLLRDLQRYIDGEYVYIPKLDSKKKKWGETTGSKKMVQARNNEIYHQYLLGTSTKELASLYFLSQKTIQKIIANMRQN